MTTIQHTGAPPGGRDNDPQGIHVPMLEAGRKRVVSSLSVADAMLRYGLEMDVRDMSNLKLNKLVYLAHGWNLGAFSAPLVEDEEVEAWPYGPVFPKLYCTIRLELIKSNLLQKHPIQDKDFFAEHRMEFGATTKELIWKICEIYKGLSASRLVQLTHEPGAPWDKATSIKLDTIPNSLIQEFFSGLLDKGEGVK